MRIGFFFQQQGPKSLFYLEMARGMLASVRNVMPDVEVYQLTDQHSPALDGVDGVDRCSDKVPMAVLRMMLQANCGGDWLFVDPDVVFQKDVQSVFEESFDVALTDRKGTDMEGTPYASVMPYNLGVTFSRSPAFWHEVVEYLEDQPLKYQVWEGDQRVVCEMVRLGLWDNIKILPGAIYNYPPNSPEEDLSERAIVHYKGQRKEWLNVEIRRAV